MAAVIGGMLVFYGPSAWSFSLRTRDLVATLLLADSGSFAIPSGPVLPGGPINASGSLMGDQTLRFGPTNYKGQSRNQTWYEGRLTFKAAPVAAPANSPSPTSVVTTFKMQGNLVGYAASNIVGNGGPPIFSVGLTGAGRATLVLNAAYNLGNGTVGRDVTAWIYEFAT